MRWQGDAVVVTGGGSNTIAGNFFGLRTDGTTLLGNRDGVTIYAGSDNNTVGGTTAADRNVFGGNTANGVDISGASGGSSGNVVEGNFIGTDATGTIAKANASDGIHLSNGTTNNTIGGTATGAGNVISGNSGFGISLSGTGTSGNVVEGNYLGTTVSGDTALPNLVGVYILGGAAGNTVGGLTATPGTGAGNVISGNSFDGITIDAGDNTIVQGNIIGLNAAGTAAVGNQSNGMTVLSGGNTIGGYDLRAMNVVSGNAGTGVLIDSNLTAATGNVIAANRIGTNAAGTAAIGNGWYGIAVVDEPGTVIGDTAGHGNLLSGNALAGVLLSGTTTTDTTIVGNLVGTNAAGTLALGNNSNGIQVEGGAHDNTIGTTQYGQSIITGLSSPLSITPAPGGDLYVSNEPGLSGADSIYRLNTTTGVASLIAAGGHLNISLITTDASGNIVALAIGYNGGNSVVVRIDPSNGTQTLISDLSNTGEGPTVGAYGAAGLIVEPSGSYLVSDSTGGRILRIDPATGAARAGLRRVTHRSRPTRHRGRRRPSRIQLGEPQQHPGGRRHRPRGSRHRDTIDHYVRRVRLPKCANRGGRRQHPADRPRPDAANSRRRGCLSHRPDDREREPSWRPAALWKTSSV